MRSETGWPSADTIRQVMAYSPEGPRATGAVIVRLEIAAHPVSKWRVSASGPASC
jgi:hypothetical protein